MDSRNEMVVRTVMGICEYANTEVEKMEGESISDAKIAYLLPFLRGAGYASTIALDAGLKGDVDGHVASFVDGVNHTAFLFDVHDMECGEPALEKMIDAMRDTYYLSSAYAAVTGKAAKAACDGMGEGVERGSYETMMAQIAQSIFNCGVANGIATMFKVFSGEVRKEDAAELVVNMGTVPGFGSMDHDELLAAAREVTTAYGALAADVIEGNGDVA